MEGGWGVGACRCVCDAQPLLTVCHLQMSALKERVPQTPLPPAVLQSICAEVDTAQRQQALLALLEQAVAFLGAVGSEAAREQSLQEYAMKVLLLSPEMWAHASTIGVEQHVRLSHLQSLFVALEEGTADALESVSPALPPYLTQPLSRSA